MSSAAIARVARARLFNSTHQLQSLRPRLAPRVVHPAAVIATAGFASSSRRAADASDPHHEESFEEFTARYAFHPYTGTGGGVGQANGFDFQNTKLESMYYTFELTRWRGHARYEKEFDSVQDVFELQRNLNNAFAYDLVPAPSVITAALRAARRVNDFPTAVRIFEGNQNPPRHFQSTYIYIYMLCYVVLIPTGSGV